MQQMSLNRENAFDTSGVQTTCAGLWDDSESNFRGMCREDDYSRLPNKHQPSMAQSMGCARPELSCDSRCGEQTQGDNR